MKGINISRKKVLIPALMGLFWILLSLFTVRVRASEIDDDVVPDNGIPVVILNIDESRGTIEDMTASPDHSVYCYGTISIQVPEGFHYADFPDNVCESLQDLSMSIRGRGNSTWQQAAKKPYKIKLDKKTDIFGLGKNKHWVLVANAFDDSLLKDRITGWLGDEMGFEFTPRGVPVDLVMVGSEFGRKYLGSYYLSENVRIDTNRLEIDELEEDDTEEPVITGGYLLQTATQVRAGSPDRFYTSRGVDWATDTPSFDTEADSLTEEEDPSLEAPLFEESFSGPELADAYKNPAQQQYIQRHIQRAEDSLFEEGYGYRELFDIESAAKYWLVNCVSLNDDAFATGSNYIYKKRDADGATGKIYWGPLWDFDFAWTHHMTTTGMKVGHLYMEAMFCDKEEGGFLEEVKKQWPAMKVSLEELARDGGIIDMYYEETRRSAEADRKINHKYDTDFDYREATEELKQWIRDRITWFNDNLSMLDDLVHQVTYQADGKFYAKDFKENNGFSYIDGTEDHPEKEGYVFLGWRTETGKLINEPTVVTEDMILEAEYIPEKEATKAVDISFRRDSDAVVYDPYLPYYTPQYVFVPTTAQDKRVTWTSSDESIATVDEKGKVTYYSAGEVTITAALRSGISRSLKLTISPDELPMPDTLEADKKNVRLFTGNQEAILLHTTPSGVKVDYYDYSSDNEEVATVDPDGVITAVAPGSATIHITTITNGKSWGSRTVRRTDVAVSVLEKLPDEIDGPTDVPSSEEIIRPTTTPKPESSSGLLGETDKKGENAESESTEGTNAAEETSVKESAKSATLPWILAGAELLIILGLVIVILRKRNKT